MLKTIDAHHHYWWHAHRTHLWPAAAGTAMERDFTPAELEPELKRAGIDGTVLVQTVNETTETNEFLTLANKTSSILGVVGWIPLDDPKATEKALDQWAGQKKLVGFRHLMRTEASPDWLLKDHVTESLRSVAKANLVFESVPLGPEQFGQVLTLAKRLPDLLIVIDHLGRPPVSEQGWEPWSTLITQAAALPNLAIKLSIGFDLSLRWRWSTDQIRRYVEHVVQNFGPKRTMAASNWPVVLYSASYQDIWEGQMQMIASLSPEERAEVKGGAAQRVYGLD